jgi:hypothetical protein
MTRGTTLFETISNAHVAKRFAGEHDLIIVDRRACSDIGPSGVTDTTAVRRDPDSRFGDPRPSPGRDA